MDNQTRSSSIIPDHDLESIKINTHSSRTNDSALVSFLIVLILVLLGTTGYLYFQNQQSRNLLVSYQSQIIPKSPTTSIPITTTPGTIVDSTANWKTYTSVESNFRVTYPPDFSLVSADSNFIPAYNLTSVVNLRKTGFADKTSQYSQAANFVVSTSKDIVNCYMLGDTPIAEKQTIGNITYNIIKISNGATGHSIDGTIYRVINNKTCIEIETSIQSETGSGEGLDKLQSSIQSDQQRLQTEMDQILSTFKFTSL